MKYYIYLSDTWDYGGDYILELYEDNNFKNKRDFYKKCITGNSSEDNYYPYDDIQDINEFIYCIDIVVDEQIRVYYFDGYQNIDLTMSENNCNKCYLLGTLDNILNSENKEYKNKIRSMLKQNQITRYGDGFILLIHKDDHLINNLDREFIM